MGHGHTLLGVLPAGAAELRQKGGEQDVDKTMFKHRSAPSEVVPLEDALAQTCWTGAWEKRIRVLSQAI